jgi:hypothetical protein
MKLGNFLTDFLCQNTALTKKRSVCAPYDTAEIRVTVWEWLKGLLQPS